MKYLALFLLAFAVPVSAAHAVESPFTRQAPTTTHRMPAPKNPFSNSNPFANKHGQKAMDALNKNRIFSNKNVSEKVFKYNGNEDMPYNKAREKHKRLAPNSLRQNQDGSFYRE